MRPFVLLAALLATAIIPGQVIAGDPSIMIAEEPVDVDPFVEEPFYCQEWNGSATVGASDWYGTELADDIPDALIGMMFNRVTLWVGEWLPPVWTDPLALIINIYNGECPPDRVPAQSFDIPWDEVEAELAFPGPPFIVYRTTATLPAGITITAGMSIGGFVMTSWGGPVPSTGFGVTDVISGCGEFYWDGGPQGPPRWTSSTAAFGRSWDLAYCLGQQVVSVPDPALDPAAKQASWGRIKSIYRD
jgi:hypothetical protein